MQPSAGWVRLRVAPVKPVTAIVALCDPALTDFVPRGSSVSPRLGSKYTQLMAPGDHPECV